MVPTIVNVMATSLNGRIGAHSLESDDEREQLGLSHPVDRQVLFSEIRKSDAIIVGASSLRASGVCIAEPGIGGSFPTWYILAQNSLSADLPFWTQTDIPRVLVSPKPLSIPPKSGVRAEISADENPARFVLDLLRKGGHKRALLFGGGIVNRFFYEEGLVDELKLTVSPLFIAGKGTPELISPELSRHVRFRLSSSQVSESFVFLSYQVLRS